MEVTTITVFQSSPLIFEDAGYITLLPPIPLDEEEDNIRQALATNRKFYPVFKSATLSNLQEYKVDGLGILQFTGHGSDDSLLIENEYGGGERLNVNEEHHWAKELGPQLALALVLSCHSFSAGTFFLNNGARFVISCLDDKQVLYAEPVKVFTRHFYLRLADGDSIPAAFDRAKGAVRDVPEYKMIDGIELNPGEEAEKFFLRSGALSDEFKSRDNVTCSAPLPPKDFDHRQDDMHEILKSFFKDEYQLITLVGRVGVGKETIAGATGHFMARRKTWGPVVWYPPIASNNDQEDSIHRDFCSVFDVLLNWDGATEDVRNDYEQALEEIRTRLTTSETEKVNQKAVLILNTKGFPVEMISKVSRILDDLFKIAKCLKVIVVEEELRVTSKPALSKEISIKPLDFDDTFVTFQRLCPLCVCPWTPEELKKKCNNEKNRKIAMKVMGNGFPGKIRVAAQTITAPEFWELTGSRGELDDKFFESFHKRVEALLLEQSSKQNIKRFTFRTQDEVQKHFNKAMAMEQLYQKTAPTYLRPAIKGETITTTIDGKTETENPVCDSCSWVARGVAGEFYVVRDATFKKLYFSDHGEIIKRDEMHHDKIALKRLHKQGFKRYKSRSVIRAKKVTEEDMLWFRRGNISTAGQYDQGIDFMAPWGGKQRVEEGDYLVTPNQDSDPQIYRVECDVFADTYSRCS